MRTRWLVGACVVALGCDADPSEVFGSGQEETATGGAASPDADEPEDDPAPEPDGEPTAPGGADPDPGDAPQPGDDGGDRDECDAAYAMCLEVVDRQTCDDLREACEAPEGEGTGGELPPVSDDPCCGPARTQCDADGEESAATCAELENICLSDTCDTLVDVCDPTTVPVSAACAEAYNRCYGYTFLINKCERMDHPQCMSALQDDALCTAWDQSCTDREAYCDSLIAQHPDLASTRYTCTDWGHGFDRCYEEYLECDEAGDACARQMNNCASEYIYNWEFQCGDYAGSDPFDPFDPESPFP